MENIDWAKIGKFAFSILALCVVAWKLFRWSRVKKGVVLIDRATKAAQKGNMRQALSLYDQGVAQETPDMEKDDIHCYFAEACLKAGMVEKAVELAGRAVAHAPRKARGRLILGEALMKMDRWAEAEQVYNEAAAAEPDNAAVWTGLGLLGIVTERYRQAEASLKRAAELEPAKGAHYSNLAYVYAKLLDVKNAEKYLKLGKKHGDRDTKGEERVLAEARSLLGELNASLEPFGMDYPGLMRRIDRLAEATMRKAVRLVPEQGRCAAKDTKLAGRPWTPAGFSAPLDTQGREMPLLAQVNFRQMPKLDGFPDRGILQFYIADDDYQGMNIDALNRQTGFRVVWHEDDNQMEAVAVPQRREKPEGFPVERELKLSFQEGTEPVSFNDHRFEALFQEHVGVPYDELPDDFTDKLAERFTGEGHKIGGYPAFSQEDPRGDRPDYAKYDVLLLQIDSDDKAGIQWGDGGVANFFISSEDLAARKFVDVLYTWDCF